MNARTSQRRDRGRSQERRLPVPEEIRRAIAGDPEALVNAAMRIGRNLAEMKLSTSQIRNIFGEVKRMQMKGFDPYKFQLLRPRLAYAAGRHGGAVKELKDVLEVAMSEVRGEEEFRRFADFFEAILAYHREAGGRTT